MPTFRNDGERAVIYTEPDGKNIIIFDPNKNVQLVHWIPYKRLGLTLVSESYPPVPDSVLISDVFKFGRGMERRFEIEPCKKYLLDIMPMEGKLRLYLGASAKGRVITTGYSEVLDWQNAPYIRIVSEDEGISATVQAMLKE